MLSDAPPIAAQSPAVHVVTRCRACGRRVASAGCPTHGLVEPSNPGLVEATQVAFNERLEIPGYRALRFLGCGGFGDVFSAEPEGGGAKGAIKVARADQPEANARLAREIRALADVGAPHVPRLFDAGELEGGRRFVVMEYIAAPTLAERLVTASSPLSLPQAIAIAQATLRTLEAIHARGWVHRDLKPENVFIDDRLRAIIFDFGLVAPTTPADDLTRTGTVLGTAEYMAPEQCDGRADVDVRADIYAMGVLLFELLAGRPPFWGSPGVVQQGHRGRRPPRLAALVAVPPAIEEVVLRCLAKDPSERYASASDLRAAIDEALADQTARDSFFAIAPYTLLPIAAEPSPRSSPGRERRRVGLVFFEAEVDPITVQRRILALGGQLAHAEGRRYVAVYSHDVGDNPARRALRAAQDLVKRGVCERALVDLAAISIQLRPDGSRRFVSPIFQRGDRFPREDDPAGLFLMPAAAAVLPDTPGPALPDERGWLQVEHVNPSAAAEAILLKARAGPLFGRDAVIDALLQSARAVADQGTPTVTGVIAAPGHGKSHLCSVLLDRLRRLDARATVMELRAREPVAGSADQSVRDLLLSALDLPATSPPNGGRELLRERLGPARAAEVGPAVALALGWVAPDAPELRALEAAPGALRSALTLAAGEALRRRAARGPLFVVLDDAHFADEAALSALEYAALAEAGAPIWVCALGRPAFEEARPSWGERAGHRALHRLEALAPTDAAALCRHLLLPVENVPDSAVQRLVERAQAVPLILVELVRGLKRDGIVRRHPQGDAWYLATDELDRLPDLPLIEWLAHTEIDALAPSLRAHARLVALLGAEVTVPEISGVLRRLDRHGGAAEFPLDATIGAQRLLSAGVLVQQRHGRLGFRHALVREAVARSIPEALRKRIHLAAFEHYRDAVAIAEERRLSQLAYHAADAGLGPVAQSAFLTLAERARARHAYLEAERLYTRAIEASGSPPLAAFRGRGLMRYRLGRYHDALADFARAREMAADQGDAAAEIEILLDEATALDWMDDYSSSSERVEQAWARAASVSSPAIEARLQLGRGRSHPRWSRQEEAAVALARAVTLAERLGDEGYETLVIALLLLGFVYQAIGRLADGTAAVDRAVALCEEHGDTIHLVPAINMRGLLRACVGDKTGMIADFSRVLSLARELGLGMLEIVGHFNLGEYLYLMDEVDVAESHVVRAQELEKQRFGDEGRAVIALLEARLRYYQGDEARARAIVEDLRARQAAARAAERPDPLAVPAEDVLCAMIELAIGDADDAAWDALEARSAQFSVGQEQIEVLELRAIAALRRGRTAQAVEQLDKALVASARIPNAMGERLARRLAEARRTEQIVGAAPSEAPSTLDMD